MQGPALTQVPLLGAQTSQLGMIVGRHDCVNGSYCTVFVPIVLHAATSAQLDGQGVRILVVELNAVEDEAQRQVRRGRGRPEVVITEPELRNLLELQFTQVEISKLYGCSP